MADYKLRPVTGRKRVSKNFAPTSHAEGFDAAHARTLGVQLSALHLEPLPLAHAHNVTHPPRPRP